MSTDPTPWIKASASADTGNCVEMRCHAGSVEVRDTKANGSGLTLGLSKAEFASWIDGAKRGDFDRLLGD